ncbi:hypothetical protein GDO81_008346 [Engystomops pustulosus]|uniref:Uncharacterized protein n=1 Tax=Engystomops pustulosus TaxID=76066 RepID=A0AAV7CE16_ENGPU|nr:hypothetical protein GDO81_008346 [Engystomops pustulosus]
MADPLLCVFDTLPQPLHVLSQEPGIIRGVIRFQGRWRSVSTCCCRGANLGFRPSKLLEPLCRCRCAGFAHGASSTTGGSFDPCPGYVGGPFFGRILTAR